MTDGTQYGTHCSSLKKIVRQPTPIPLDHLNANYHRQQLAQFSTSSRCSLRPPLITRSILSSSPRPPITRPCSKQFQRRSTPSRTAASAQSGSQKIVARDTTSLRRTTRRSETRWVLRLSEERLTQCRSIRSPCHCETDHDDRHGADGPQHLLHLLYSAARQVEFILHLGVQPQHGRAPLVSFPFQPPTWC